MYAAYLFENMMIYLPECTIDLSYTTQYITTTTTTPCRADPIPKVMPHDETKTNTPLQ